jgi:serine/threonine-protein kinase
MSYCINPACPEPQNADDAQQCKACGWKLILADRYQITQPLGQGGFGATFLSRDLLNPQSDIYVMKELRPSSNAPQVLDMARQLFQREGKTLERVGHHPQIPKLIDYFEWEGHFYLVQEFIEGITVKQEVKQKGPYTEAQARQFLWEMLPVLDFIHSQNVIHRDIKPANIIRRNSDGVLFLIDFGAVKDKITKTMLTQGTGNTAFTQISIGTSGFAPPEQIALRPVYASDIYALAVTCIFLLTGQSPSRLGYDKSSGEIKWRNYIDVSPQFAKVLEKMLEISVRQRYQAASDVIRALEGKTDADLMSSMTSYGGGNTVTTPNTNTQITQFGDNEEKTVFEENTVFENNPTRISTSFSSASEIAESIRAQKARLAKRQGGDLNTGISQAKSSPNSRTPSPYSGSNTTKPNIAPSANTRDNSRIERRVAPLGQGNTVPPKTTKTKWTANDLRSSYIKGERDFADQDLSGLNLQKAQLAGANFYGAKLEKTNLQGANLVDVNFGHCHLENAILRDSNLTNAYMSTASLEGADLRGADLTGCYLRAANLRGANLCGANLTNATISDSQLSMAKTNWFTIKPNGKR